MHITSSWRKQLGAVCAAALAVPLALGAGVASAAQPAVAQPTTTLGGLCSGSTPASTPCVTALPDIQGQTLKFSVRSPAMQRDVPIQMLVPPGYNALDASATYPELYQLDGLRADPNITDWTRKADTQTFFVDKRVLVVQVIGGYGSFFQNWAQQDAGILNQSKQTPGSPAGVLKWETFLTGELPQLIGSTFHGNGQRAISGLSMGGFSAFSLAAKHPTLYKAAASYSGCPASEAPGLPEFLRYVLEQQSGAQSADNMWGPYPGPAWTANDPAAQIANLKGKSLYMSAGTGASGGLGTDQPIGITGLSQNYIGALIEVVANYSSQGFAVTAAANGIPVTTDLTHPGVHDWPYWNVQFKQSWPQLAQAIGASSTAPGANFTVQGAIADKWYQLGGAQGVLGSPTSNELTVPGGKVSHFEHGDIYFSNSTGAHEVQGAILAKYVQLGASSGFLGFPVTDETTTPVKREGRYNQFSNGYIYWTPATGAHEVHGAILAEWGRQGYENSRFGFPTSDEFGTAEGRRSNFQGGFISFVFATGQIITS